MSDNTAADIEAFFVVKNAEEQYSIWPAFKAIPLGWETVGFSGSKEACLEYISQIWTDMRPLSLRQHLQE
jgi:MbtH protein